MLLGMSACYLVRRSLPSTKVEAEARALESNAAVVGVEPLLGGEVVVAGPDLGLVVVLGVWEVRRETRVTSREASRVI
jgi:hypothetical protein